MITTELGFEVEASRRTEQPESWAIDTALYEANLDPELKAAFESDPTRANAEAISLNSIIAVFASLRKGASIVLNSSTGKDSTLLTALYFKAAEKWASEGNKVPSTTIAIADTGAEFPRLNQRIYGEEKRLNTYALKKGLPIKVIVERARAKSRLFAEIFGNGRPLPALASGEAKNASGTANSAWCMDRVKKGPLDAINKRVTSENPYYIQMIGVRYDESTSRDKRIARYSEGLAPGLTRIGGLIDEDSGSFGQDTRLGSIPIVDWPTELVEDFLRCAEMPWNYATPFELAKIYYTASSKGEQEATQCDITLTKDGGISNKCEGFDGARLGCWMCVKSVNKSLSNMHRNDSRELRGKGQSPAKAKHRWLRGFHKYLIGLHARYANCTSDKPVSGILSGRRVKIDSIVKSLGKDTNVLFCKNINFEERARLLLLLFRAEIESGFRLIEEDELKLIQLYWKKAGVHHVHVEEIRDDAMRWKETGKPVLSYLRFTELADRTDIAAGIPAAAYFHTADLAIKNNFQPLKLLHLLPLRSHGTPLIPTVRAYVFERRERENNELMVMVTDMPSVLGAKTNTNLLNGLSPFAWRLRGTRDLTDWESTMFRSSGRNFFYSHLQDETDRAIDEYLAASEVEVGESLSYRELRRSGEISVVGGFFPHTRPLKLPVLTMRDTIMQNLTAANHCGSNAEPLDEHFMMGESAASLRGRITFDKLKEVMPVVRELAELSDYTEFAAQELVSELESFAAGKWHLLEHFEKDIPKEKKDFQAGLIDIAKRRLLVERTMDHFERYQQLVGVIISEIKQGNVNAALISRLAFIARNDRYDEEYAEKLTTELLELLDLLPRGNAAMNAA
jgi:3'-phosphoadenosine 5'-phosphosulfate sulfotransferase (PAPS reductase)/FAD synthetase